MSGLGSSRPYSSLLDGGGVLLSALGSGGGGGSGQGNVIQSVGVLVSGSVVGNLVSGGGIGIGGGGSGDKSERLFYHAIDCLRPTNTPVKELKGPVGELFLLLVFVLLFTNRVGV